MPPSLPANFRWILPPPVVGLAWILACGVVDWLTGPELALSAFYLPGVALVAWFSGRKPALVMAICAALVWLGAELASDALYSKPFVPYWNATIRLSVFIITAFLTSEVRARQQTEAALREQDSILRSILDSMGDGVVVIGGNGTVLAFNPAAERLFGTSPVGSDALEWIKEIESCQLDEICVDTGKPRLLRQAVSGQLSGSHEIALRRTDDVESKLLGLTVMPLVAREGKTAGVVMVIADLTARRTMEKRIAEASEREQRRIGQDLHDGVCQHLVGVAFAAGSLQSVLESHSHEAEAAAAGEIANLINDAISEARNLAHGLYPAGLEEGIEIALRTLASTTHERIGIVCTARISGGTFALDSVSAMHLYRIAQECISNANRHGAAKTIVISLEHQNGHLRLAVSDDGMGMDISSPTIRGIGLNLMRYRASLMGGTLEIESQPGQGTRIICNLPHSGTTPSAA